MDSAHLFECSHLTGWTGSPTAKPQDGVDDYLHLVAGEKRLEEGYKKP